MHWKKKYGQKETKERKLKMDVDGNFNADGDIIIFRKLELFIGSLKVSK